MKFNAIENVAPIKFDLTADFSTKTKKHINPTENLPELLVNNKAASKPEIKPKKPKEEKSSLLSKILTCSDIIALSALIFMLTPYGRAKIFKRMNNIMGNRFKSKGLKRLKSVRANMPHVKDIPFIKSNSLDELQQMAKRLGIKIKCDGIPNSSDIEQYNTTLKLMTDIHNKSKGRIKLPKTLTIEDIKEYSGFAYRSIDKITLDRKSFNAETIFHEIGHLNHFEKGNLQSLLPKKIALKTQPPNSAVVRFYTDPKLRQEIEQHLGSYATTHPEEFVAETFAKLMDGGTVPNNLKKLYAQFQGTPRVPVINTPPCFNIENLPQNKFKFSIKDFIEKA